MGVNISEILDRKELVLSSLRDKVIAVDAHIFLYQFLTTIRQSDGSFLMDSRGNITSHLSGLFARNINLMQQGLKLVYVFDGKAPELKIRERERRKTLKEEALEKYEKATAAQNIEEMKKYAARTTRLTSEMIEESKKLIVAMGIPIVEAPSEGEAQAAYMVKQDRAFAVASQDADSLMFGATRVVRNLSLVGKRKKTNKLSYETIKPEIISLGDTLNNLGLDQDQLIVLGMLVGTDFNEGGIKGIGPQKGLKLIKEFGTDFDKLFESVKWNDSFLYPWTEVFYLFKKIPVIDDYDLSWKPIDRDKVYELLVEEHDFSRERVLGSFDKLIREKEKNTQKGLGEFF